MKNGSMHDDYDLSCGEEHEMDDESLSMSDDLEENNRDKYTYLSLKNQ